MTSYHQDRGFALLAVLVVLSMLLALAVPFALAMGNGDTVSRQLADDKQVALLSQSVRELVLHEASLTHATLDEDPSSDVAEEFPAELVLPAAFAPLRGDALRPNLLAAETEDLQRRVNLNTATPLLLANLLGLAARLTEEHDAEVTELLVDDASRFPDEGYLLVDGELVRYGGRDGNAFRDLERGLLSLEKGFSPGDEHTLANGALVLDFRTVLAVTHSFYHAEGDRRDRWRPYGSVDEVHRIAELGFGGFSPAQVDVLREHCTVASVRENAADWGRPERLFEPVELGALPWEGRQLVVRSATDIGGGRLLRLRSLEGGASEYAWCFATTTGGGTGIVNLPQPRWRLRLLRPPSRSLDPFTTVVEVLLPHPINVNTAAPEVLAALVGQLRTGRPLAHNAPPPRPFHRGEARAVAEALVALRGDADFSGQLGEGPFAGSQPRPFDSFEDLAKRYFAPVLNTLDQRDKSRMILLYRGLLGNGTGDLDMVTAPLTFTSAPVVAYRAAAARLRGNQVSARMERTGVAVALPDRPLDLILATQAAFEDAMRLDRRMPWYTTHPINLGSYIGFEPAANPPSRHYAHVLALAYPDIGFGQPRYPSRDGESDGVRLAPAVARFGFDGRRLPNAQESMWNTLHPEGRDVTQEGPYQMFNNGPVTGGPGVGGGAAPGQGSARQAPRSGGRGHQPSFPYTGSQGLPQRHAVSFWFQPRDVGDQMLFDLSADETDRNRIQVAIRGQQLEFRVLDEAGLDPDTAAVQQVQTSPQETAGTWSIPLAEIDLRPGIWYHVNLAADGNRPGQLTMLVDGVPRGEPQGRTYLARRIDEYQRPVTPIVPFTGDRQKYVDIFVEDTDGFPPRGVVRIGLELFEYTSKTSTTFRCEFNDSFGGRTARMSLREFVPAIPLDNNGRPTVNPEQLQGLDVAPAHEIGAAVELYGYTVAIYRNAVVQVGEGQLTSALGAWAVARVTNQQASIVVQGPGWSFELGRGIAADDPLDLELGDPVATINPPGPASTEILSAFSENGGYALLMQDHWPSIGPLTSGANSVSQDVGGIELIRYGGRNGHKLTGVQRGAQLNTIAGEQFGSTYDGRSRQFVTQWSAGLTSGQPEKIPFNELPTQLCYIVPISIPARGNFVDPSVLGLSEWVQLYPRGGDEAETEWVRYDHLDPQGWLVRTHVRSWIETYNQLVNYDGPRAGVIGPLGGELPLALALREPYPAVTQDTRGHVGYTDQVEVSFPQIQLARLTLGFRGDPSTGTTSHAQLANTVVLPCHRMELDWGNYGALSGRAGRNDRIALVGGSQASGSARPPVDWHTVNWVMRRFGFDPRQSSPGAPVRPGATGSGQAQGTTNLRQELLGPYPFQLVAYKEGVRDLFIGPQNRNFQEDSRLIDRMVKFPSGELPAAAPEDAYFGSTLQKDLPDLRGVVDELVAVGRRSVPVLLDEPFGDAATEFLVRPEMLVTPQGEVVVGGDLTAEMPAGGGLVWVDGEVIAYEAHQDGRFTVARDGRGLLGTEPRHHDEGALVAFLDHVPAAILNGAVSEGSAQLLVNDIGDLPRDGGTLLLGRTELLHYTWSVGRQLLEMPEWADPESPQTRGLGLFRGRYGTTPVGASAGQPLVWFPTRYWDRYHERADDPEMAYSQVTWDLAPVYFKSLAWQEERDDELLDVACLVRIDGRKSFADDPEQGQGLWLFRDAVRPQPIGWQGSRLEARFATIYRPGAFDPQTFKVHTWKKAPTLRAVVLDYEGESRVLEERVTAR